MVDLSIICGLCKFDPDECGELPECCLRAYNGGEMGMYMRDATKEEHELIERAIKANSIKLGIPSFNDIILASKVLKCLKMCKESTCFQECIGCDYIGYELECKDHLISDALEALEAVYK